MATEGHLEQFIVQFKTWKELDFEKIYREDLGTESFLNIHPLIKDFTNKINRINQIKEKLGDNLLSQVYTLYKQIINLLIQLSNFDNSNFVSKKVHVENQLRVYNEQLLNFWPQIVAVFLDSSKETDFVVLLEELDKRSKKSEEDAKTIEDLKFRLSSELNDFENKYRELFKKNELVFQKEVFLNQAVKYNDNAKNWFWGFILSACILIFMIWLVFKNFCFELSCFSFIENLDYNLIDLTANKTILYLEVFKAIAFRLFIISFLVYVVSFCVKNYNANKHNYTVNSQKSNSITAALVLLERAKTNDGNDNIMIQAANSIFSHQPTAFNKKDPENISSFITKTLMDKSNPIKM